MAGLRPPLDLNVEVTDANGVRTTWGQRSKAADIPRGITFKTKRGEGFADANVTLARRIDREYIDLSLLDSVAMVGADGSTAYEGRVAHIPRSLQQVHSATVTCAGWMAHAKDRKFTELFVDRNPAGWVSPPSVKRQSNLATTHDIMTFQTSVAADNTDGMALSFQGKGQLSNFPIIEAIYDAGANTIARIRAPKVTIIGYGFPDANQQLYAATWSTDAAAATSVSANLGAGAAPTAIDYTPATPYRYGVLQHIYNAAGPSGSVAVTYGYQFTGLNVIGNHGLTLRAGSTAYNDGFSASDIITNVANRFCPLLNTSGVQTTTYPIPHLVFPDPTFPYDAFLKVNTYHLWQLAVWENRTLTYGPVDLTDYQWEVRLSDPGVTVDLQGTSSQELANGIIVEYQDVVTGRKTVLTPTGNTSLQDTSPANPANTHGLNVWTTLQLSIPTDNAGALAIGQAALAEYNQPKSPGTIKIKGHVRDRAGHWQQGWKVRAGDTIAITDHPNDRPRLVVETDWNHDAKELSISVDGTFKRLDALIDRLATGLEGLGVR